MKNKKVTPTTEMLDSKNSLELFVQCWYDLSGVESDSEWISDFKRNYSKFCLKFRIKEDELRSETVAAKYSLGMGTEMRKKLVRVAKKKA
jgi:hypothetical protein